MVQSSRRIASAGSRAMSVCFYACNSGGASLRQRFVNGFRAVLVFVGACMVAGIWSVPALSAPAVFFNDNLANGRSTFISTVASADATAVVIEFDILNNSTNSSGVTTITAGSETIYVRTTQAGNVARNNQNGDLGNGGFTIWSNSYSGSAAWAPLPLRRFPCTISANHAEIKAAYPRTG